MGSASAQVLADAERTPRVNVVFDFGGGDILVVKNMSLWTRWTTISLIT